MKMMIKLNERIVIQGEMIMVVICNELNIENVIHYLTNEKNNTTIQEHTLMTDFNKSIALSEGYNGRRDLT